MPARSWACACCKLFQSRTDALERASETSRNLGLIVERDIQRNFELYDLSLQAVIDGLKRPDVMNAPPSVRRAVLFDNAMTARFLGSMLVLDADGNIVLDSATDVRAAAILPIASTSPSTATIRMSGSMSAIRSRRGCAAAR